MNRRIAIVSLVPLICILMVSMVFCRRGSRDSKRKYHGPPCKLAGLLDKLLDPESKESKVLSGAVSILGSTSELDYKSERTIGESLALEGFFAVYGLPV